jgi:hypothetical protein
MHCLKSTIPKCRITTTSFHDPLPLRIRQYQPPVIRIIYRILLPGYIELRRTPLRPRRLMIDLPMHAFQKRRRGARKPAPAAELEGTQVPAPVRRAEDCVGVLLEFFEGEGGFGGYLE